MSMPTISVRIAFATNPLATPTWTDVSSYVRSLRIRRGREDELGRVEAGTAEVVLDNRDRRFDPTHAGGAYYPNVLPMRRISIRAVWNSVAYALFHGFIEGWPVAWPPSDDSSVTVPAADAFMYFALQDQIAVSFSADTAGPSISTILGLANWNPADDDIATGLSTLQAWSESAGTPILNFLTRLVDSENGYFWVGGDGIVYFRDRHYRLENANSITSTGIFGDLAGELSYVAIRPQFDQIYIRNDIRVQRTGGVVQTAFDSASAAKYFRRAYTKSDLLMATDADAADAAAWLLTSYKEPALRIPQIEVNPQANDTALWPHALGRELHERITVRRRPPGGGSLISQDYYIEGVEHEALAGPVTSWTTRWNLSPAANVTFWILDDPVLSILDSTTILGY